MEKQTKQKQCTSKSETYKIHFHGSHSEESNLKKNNKCYLLQKLTWNQTIIAHKTYIANPSFLETNHPEHTLDNVFNWPKENLTKICFP